jgi:GntR family transcriptional regulator
MAVDRANSKPLQAQLAGDIRRRITAGEFSAGDRLPPLRALTAEYGVAEMTMHAAIRVLQRQGIVVSSRGRGTFVADDVATFDLVNGIQSDERASVQTQLDELRSAVRHLAARVDSLESHAAKSTAAQDARP